MKKLVLFACILLVSVASAYAQFTFTSIDCPGGVPTTARGINNQGEIVGSHAGHAVLINNGQCTPLAPTTVLGTQRSVAFKNNDRGDVVGYYVDNDGLPHGFLLSKKGVLTLLDFPGAGDTQALGINESGTVVGLFDIYDAQGNFIVEHGFTWDNGAFSQVDDPGAADTALLGINARGDIVGVWDSGPPDYPNHGFIQSKHGQFTNFDVPFAGGTQTQPNDINANGKIVGLYVDAGGAIKGFLGAGATFTSIDFPGATSTQAWGINSAGQIVGSYRVGAALYGFLAVPTKK
jgi:uncharacterized membrane protein